MIEVTTKFICDRCGKVSNENYFPKCRFSLRKKRIFKWNGDFGGYETAQLCKECAASFDEWLKGGEE